MYIYHGIQFCPWKRVYVIKRAESITLNWRVPTSCIGCFMAKSSPWAGCFVCVQISKAITTYEHWFSGCIPLLFCAQLTTSLFRCVGTCAGERLLAECTQLNVGVRFVGRYDFQVIAYFCLSWHTRWMNAMRVKLVLDNASLRNWPRQMTKYTGSLQATWSHLFSLLLG